MTVILKVLEHNPAFFPEANQSYVMAAANDVTLHMAVHSM